MSLFSILSRPLLFTLAGLPLVHFFLPTPLACAEAWATGVVYEDHDRDGRRDADEAGIAGVAVSNGDQVVRSDDDGRYRLPVGENTILFVIKPRGYDTARDERLKLPRFYYHHRPGGTPDGSFVFKGVEPTGPLPASIDFPLTPRPEADAFRIVLMGDPQVYDTQELLWYARDMAPELAKIDADFAIALGDLVGDNLNLLEPYNQVNAVCDFPWYNVLGNHDLNYYAPDDEDSDATFERAFGPSTYAFQHGPVHFLILNNVYWPGFKGIRRDGWPRRSGYSGRLRPEQLRFVANYLAEVPPDDLIVIATHIPLSYPFTDEVTQNTAELPELMNILSAHPRTLSFSGHTHINYNLLLGSAEGYRAQGNPTHLHCNVGTASGSWYKGPVDERGLPISTMRDGTPPGFAIAEFEGNDYRLTFRPFGKPADHQILIHLPELVQADVSDQITVQANVFNATAESTVRMRVVGDSQVWQPMTAARMNDPQYQANFQRREAEIAAYPELMLRKLNKPMATDHHYVAVLPKLAPGTHLIEVQTTDRYGQSTHATRPLQVVESLDAWTDLDSHNIRNPRSPKSD